MATRVYGASDDLIEFEGDFHGEVCKYGTDEEERGVLLAFSDGTLLEAQYSKNVRGVWAISLIHKGSLFDCIVPCDDPDADPHSDVAHFWDGMRWAYAAKEWEPVN